MSKLIVVLDELVAGAPLEALSWSDVEARSRKRYRRVLSRRLVAALAITAALAVTGAAVGVGLSLLDQQKIVQDRGPQRLGPLVEITSSENWSLIAWQSNVGICLDFAIPGNSTFSCAIPVRGANPATDESGSRVPVHAVAGLVSGNLVGGDGQTTIFGIAARDVATVKIELDDGRTMEPPLYDAPPELDTDVRFFIVRAFMTQQPSEMDTDGPNYGPDGDHLAVQRTVRAYRAYDPYGNLIESVTG